MNEAENIYAPVRHDDAGGRSIPRNPHGRPSRSRARAFAPRPRNASQNLASAASDWERLRRSNYRPARTPSTRVASKANVASKRSPRKRSPLPESKAGILFRPRAAKTCTHPALSTYGGRPSRLGWFAAAGPFLIKVLLGAIVVVALVLGTRMVTNAVTRSAAASEFETSVSSQLKTLADPIGDEERAALVSSLAADPAAYTSAVAAVLQGDAYPSGCEPASLTSVLASMGVGATLDDVVGYLNIDPDFVDYVYHYAGDPAGSGSAWPQTMVDTASRYLAANSDGDLSAVNISGASFDQLEQIVEAGYPVMVWTTTYMEEPDFSDYEIFGYPFVVNNHCVVMYGVADDGADILVMDPLEGMVTRDASDFAGIYEERGRLAMAVVPADVLES